MNIESQRLIPLCHNLWVQLNGQLGDMTLYGQFEKQPYDHLRDQLWNQLFNQLEQLKDELI